MASQKNALIVGASRGLGLGLVETFLHRHPAFHEAPHGTGQAVAALPVELFDEALGDSAGLAKAAVGAGGLNA